ncbi:hypothetical protein OHB54_39905 [Streptomyces sp. NBC_01007]|nr:hypothetical protein OHB54_39905 [Streptomyces sp. NBC_01007]
MTGAGLISSPRLMVGAHQAIVAGGVIGVCRGNVASEVIGVCRATVVGLP